MKKFLPVFMFFLSMLFFTSCDCDRDLTLNILSNNNVDVTVDTTKVTEYATEATPDSPVTNSRSAVKGSVIQSDDVSFDFWSALGKVVTSVFSFFVGSIIFLTAKLVEIALSLFSDVVGILLILVVAFIFNLK